MCMCRADRERAAVRRALQTFSCFRLIQSRENKNMSTGVNPSQCHVDKNEQKWVKSNSNVTGESQKNI